MFDLFDLVLSLGAADLTVLFMLTILLDIPRYLFAAIAVNLLPAEQQLDYPARVTLIVATRERAAVTAQTIASLPVDQVIVVVDGGHDTEVPGHPDATLVCLPERCGKPEAINRVLPLVTGNIVVIADDDTVFATGALRQVLSCFADPKVAAVAFDLRVRNEGESIATLAQAVEYVVTIGLGRRFADALGLLPLVCGAAGAYRTEALRQVGGVDYEVAEDAATSMRLRTAGYRIRHASGALAYTRVPATITDLILQRMRWDASIVTIWWRKYGPLQVQRLNDLLTVFDVLLFNAVLPLLFPFYVLWMLSVMGSFALLVIIAVSILLLLMNVVIIMLAQVPLRLLLAVPAYIAVHVFILRPVRVVALLLELMLSITRHDPYIPPGERHRLT